MQWFTNTEGEKEVSATALTNDSKTNGRKDPFTWVPDEQRALSFVCDVLGVRNVIVKPDVLTKFRFCQGR